MIAFILAAQILAATPTPTAASTPTPAPVVAAGTGATRTLSDLARERKLVGTPNRTGPTRAGGATASTVAPQAAGQSADTTGCSRSAEAKLDELNRRNLSSEAYSRQKRWIHEEEVSCSVVAIDEQNVADAKQELEGARAGVGQALRNLLSYPTKQTAAQVLKAAGPPAAKRNVTTTVGRDGTMHTSEQWVYPGIGYVYFRDGVLETVQTK